MDPEHQLEDLKNTAARLSIAIEAGNLGDDEFPTRGGYCRLRGQDLILLDRRLHPAEQVNIILEALSRFDLEAVYLPSWVRERLSVKT
ncbi:MAG: hypothetical protein JSU88_09445 [Nitrospinaceae bacterium]|jgi:hypothetical protein|nr:MAG: hypothetical protein JSU88_09445 [Nitrospinaceae bacterium]